MDLFSKFDEHIDYKKSEKLYWIPNDTEELFLNNLKKYSDSNHLISYKENPITYELNNYGFRTPDDFYDGDEGTVYLGCSHTFGIAHYLENVWSYKLHKKIGKGKFFNLSRGATGLYSQYYFLKYFSTKLKINKVFHFYPKESNFRYGFMDKDEKIRVIGHFAEDSKNKLDEDIWKQYLIHDSYNKFHNSVFKDAIKNICNEIGCEYLLNEDSQIVWVKNDSNQYVGTLDPYNKKMTPARDLLHYYVEKQHDIYNNFLKISEYKNDII